MYSNVPIMSLTDRSFEDDEPTVNKVLIFKTLL